MTSGLRWLYVSVTCVFEHPRISEITRSGTLCKESDEPVVCRKGCSDSVLDPEARPFVRAERLRDRQLWGILWGPRSENRPQYATKAENGPELTGLLIREFGFKSPPGLLFVPFQYALKRGFSCFQTSLAGPSSSWSVTVCHRV